MTSSESTIQAPVQAGAVIAVWMNGSRNHDGEFYDWYETEHLALVVSIPGILAARRYFNARGDLPYLVFYEATDEEVERGSGFQSMLLNPTPWTVRIRKLCEKPSRRINFRVLHDTGEARDARAVLAIDAGIATKLVAPQSRRDVTSDCLRSREFEDVDRPGSRWEIYDFPDASAALKAKATLKIAEASRVEIYEAIGRPHVRVRS